MSHGNSSDIYLRTRRNNGTTFGDTMKISNSTNHIFAIDRHMSAVGKNLYIVWSQQNTIEPKSNNILYRTSKDSGTLLGNIIKLNDNNHNNQPNATNPQIASAYANNMYTVWQSKVGKSSNIFFKRSIDNGSSFQDTINLSDNLGNSSYPQVATSARNVYVIWKNDNSNFGNQIFFKRSTDSGYSFGRKFSKVDISNTTASIGSPQIEADGRYVNIIWSEKNASNGNWQLWFTRRVNSGDFRYYCKYSKDCFERCHQDI
jgi:hypothetical protein